MRKATTSRCVLRGRHLRRRNLGAVTCARGLGPATQFRLGRPPSEISLKETSATNRLTHSAMLFTSLSVVLPVVCAAGLSAQTRLNDKDVLQHMKKLKDDTKKFRPSFNSTLAKSTIRETTQEKDAQTLGQNFEQQTNSKCTKRSRKHQGRTVPAELPRYGAADRQNHNAAGPRRHYALVGGEDRTEYPRKRV